MHSKNPVIFALALFLVSATAILSQNTAESRSSQGGLAVDTGTTWSAQLPGTVACGKSGGAEQQLGEATGGCPHAKEAGCPHAKEAGCGCAKEGGCPHAKDGACACAKDGTCPCAKDGACACAKDGTCPCAKDGSCPCAKDGSCPCAKG